MYHIYIYICIIYIHIYTFIYIFDLYISCVYVSHCHILACIVNANANIKRFDSILFKISKHCLVIN